MTFDVIMPALGMAQDTGLLVAWRKALGDAVTADEVLMEVETDKSTIEVPAGHDGYVAELRADAGEDVPVGQVVAVIHTDKPDLTAAAARPTTAGASKPEPVPASKPAAALVAARPMPVVTSPPPVTVAPGRVLASPKARRVALERNIDLIALVARGAAQPIHVKDLDSLPGLATRARIGAGLSLVTARCDSAAFDRVVDRLGRDRAVTLEPHLLAAGFCAASLRAVTQAESIVVVVEAGLDGRRVAYRDPDLARASRPRLAGGNAIPSLILRDFTQSRITGIAISNDSAPAIAIGKAGGFFELSLAFSEDQLAGNAAIALLSSLADRMENPLDNLV
jgi:Biotin-requiring enzyme